MLLKVTLAMTVLIYILCAIAAVLPEYGTPLMGLILVLIAACLFGIMFECMDRSEGWDNEE